MKNNDFRRILKFLREQFPVDKTEAVVHTRLRKISSKNKYESLMTFSNYRTRKDSRSCICFYIRVDAGLDEAPQKDNLLHEWSHIHAILDACFHRAAPLTWDQWHGKMYAAWERWDETST
jgi:hypothetical protein